MNNDFKKEDNTVFFTISDDANITVRVKWNHELRIYIVERWEYCLLTEKLVHDEERDSQTDDRGKAFDVMDIMLDDYNVNSFAAWLSD